MRSGRKRKACLLEELSVIIPTLNAGHMLPRLISQLSGVREVIISDGGSDALPDGAIVVTGPPGRGGQLARGADAATGAWYLFLHADSQLPDDWHVEVAQHMAARNDAAAFRLRFDSSGLAPKVVAFWANLRSRLGLPYGDQGLLVSAVQYEAAGGYPDIPLMEDVAMVRALGWVRLLRLAITTSGQKYERDGWFRRGAANLRTLLRYLAGADPAQLAQEYMHRDQS